MGKVERRHSPGCCDALARDGVVLADDDVRWDARGCCARAVALLDEATTSCAPRTTSTRCPGTLACDSARSLLNRVWTGDPAFPGGDFPGTLAVRRATRVAAGGYDGDVMFEEPGADADDRGGGRDGALSRRSLRAQAPADRAGTSPRGGRGRPTTTLRSRPAWPLLLSVIPAAAVAAARRRHRALGLAAAAVALTAEVGRRRAGGGAHFSATSSLLAPAWAVERGVRRLARRRAKAQRRGDVRRQPHRALGQLPTRAVACGRAAVDLAPGREPGDGLVGSVAERGDAGTAAAAEGDRAAASPRSRCRPRRST